MTTPTSPIDPLTAPDRQRLHDALLEVFAAHHPAPADTPSPWPDVALPAARFVELARGVLRHQLGHNAAYARYVRRMGVDVDALAADFDPFTVPPIPTDAFKRAWLASFAPERAVVTFRSSGTTERDRGRHPFATLALTRAAAAAAFATWFTPDVEPERGLRVVVLMPRHDQQPDSSLGFMLDEVVRAGWGDDDSVHLVDADTGLDVEGLVGALESATRDAVPVLLCGPSFSYVHALDALAQRGDWRVQLPAGSRLLETGGFKGRSRTVSRLELHAALIDRLGLDPAMIAGEYGMSELSSQLYEPTVRHGLSGVPGDPIRLYVAPPWCAVRVVDPTTLAPVEIGEPGQVALLDLANLDSVAHVITGDLGRLVPLSGAPWGHGLELHGRAADAAPKGCSLAIDALLGG